MFIYCNFEIFKTLRQAIDFGTHSIQKLSCGQKYLASLKRGSENLPSIPTRVHIGIAYMDQCRYAHNDNNDMNRQLRRLYARAILCCENVQNAPFL